MELVTLAQRPEIAEAMQQINIAAWPAFMKQAGASDRHWSTLLQVYPEYQLALCDNDHHVMAIGHLIPAIWDGTSDGLPNGWDDVLMTALNRRGRSFNAICMMGAVVSPASRTSGLGLSLLRMMKQFAFEHSPVLIAPVRPVLKPRYPLTPIERYIRWTYRNGANLPFDPWLRVHVRLGAAIIKGAPHSMVVTGSVAQWELWSGMRFPESGLYIVPDALHAISIDYINDIGKYEEPHVWVHYPFNQD